MVSVAKFRVVEFLACHRLNARDIATVNVFLVVCDKRSRRPEAAVGVHQYRLDLAAARVLTGPLYCLCVAHDCAPMVNGPTLAPGRALAVISAMMASCRFFGMPCSL